MSMKEEIMAAIGRHGYDELKEMIVPNLLKMVRGTKLKNEFGVHIIAVEYSHYTPDGLDTAVECLLEVMPEDEETERLREAYKYFKENREEILADHNITP